MCSARVLVTRSYSCSCARGSPKRQEFFKKKGLFQVGGLAITLLMPFDAEHSFDLPAWCATSCICVRVCVTVLAGAVHRRS
jgi:hypothetical protein